MEDAVPERQDVELSTSVVCDSGTYPTGQAMFNSEREAILMKQVQLHGINDVRLMDVPEPNCGPDDVVVDVAFCGICGSDMGYISAGGARGPGGPAMALGHEFAGTISAIGAQVSHWRVGQMVTVSPMSSANLIGNGGPEGAFAAQVCIRDAEAPGTVLALPEGLSPELGALAEPLSVAFHAVSRVPLNAESQVLVTGAGPIGLCCVLALKYFGVKDVVVVEPSEFRRNTALRLGADAVFPQADGAFWEALFQRHGEDNSFFGMRLARTDAYFECSGFDQILNGLLNFARPRAEIMLIAAYKHEIALKVSMVMGKELRLAGSMGSGDSFTMALEYLKTHGDKAAPLISHRFKLAHFDQALATARDASIAAKVLVMP